MTEASVISVLHVDDDPAFADLTAEMLSEHEAQFTVETAIDASEGRDRLATHSFDCIVSDYEMPGQNGIEFLETIREKHPDLPFILYTAKGSEAVASDAIAAGVTDYLQKESGTSQYTVLANKIRNAVERYRQRERAQATRDRLRQIIDLLPQLVFVKDEGGEFLLANEATADAYGTTVGNLEGATDADFADSTVKVEAFRADDRAVIESSEPKHIPEESLTTADGETRLLETTKIPYDPVETDADAVLDVSMDITERKEREAELEMQSTAMEAAMDGISILNEDGKYVYMNQAHADVFGYDANELLGSTWRRLYGDGEIARIEQEVFPVLEREGEWRGETVGKRRDGSPVHQEITLSLLNDGKLICTNRDITERKEREQKLRRVTERFERFANNVQDAFFILSADYSETEYVNSAVERIYGVTPEEANDNPMVWLRHIHPDDKDELLTDVEAQQDGSVKWPVEQEFRIDHPDRGVRWVQARLNTIPDENGDPSRLAGVTTDITDRKQREESINALLEVTRELMSAQSKQAAAEQAIDAARSVLDQPISGLWLRDSDEEVLQPVAMTAEAAEVVGAPPTYSAGESLSWEAFAANELRVYDDVRAHPERFNTETSIRSEIIIPLGEHGVINMGSAEPAEFSEIDVSIARIFGRTVEMALDRADREQRLLNQRSRLQQQNDRLDEFTSVVSHDLRNPLNVATGRLELITEECDSDHLDSLRRALNRMETLIDDLLALAREGKDVTDAQPVDLSAVVNRCWENVETNQASLITDIDGDVCADKSRLKQAFENLFRNAVEHGRADVTVTVGRLRDGLYIEDDGPGIPSDERDAVFEAGYSRSTDGTGFGLSIVKQIINAHDWQIRIADGTNGGARFEITSVEFVTVQGSPSGADSVEGE
jgi:PAS domain S-box-containing protein